MLFAALFGWQQLAIISTILLYLYYRLTRNYSYWSSRSINGPKPLPILGTMWQMFQKPAFQINLDNRKTYGNLYGTYLGTRPVLVLTDPQLIKDVNIKDFNIFVDRNDLINFNDPIADRALFTAMGDKWKSLRSVISPTFSSGKMRAMHPIIIECVKRLDRYLSDKKEIEMTTTMSKMTMDVIVRCAFGNEIDTYDEQRTHDFIVYSRRLLSANWRTLLTFIVGAISQDLLQWSGLKLIDPAVETFFRSAIKTIVDKRRADGSGPKHKDYIQLMIDARNKTSLSSDNNKEVDDNIINSDEIFTKTAKSSSVDKHFADIKGEVDDDDVLANSIIFLVAGYDTSSMALSFLFYALALHPDCQQKLYDEIKRFDNQYDYETIAKMSYLEACVAETLRVYNPISTVGRMAAREYTVGDTGITVPKGMLIMCDIQSLHRNPEYFPDPDRWNPERFMPYNRDKLVPYTYMPFGLGPRNCVGMRFALMEMKTAVAYLITRYRFIQTANTTIPLTYAKYDFLLRPCAVNIGIERRL
ncbi:cytochrome P450 3A8-like [Oppia nitens]|uniref:cytochrome P450 3A8-like n=1 Tax=Oppia nitens TaxID=1686743 RepID=UPI0023D9EB5D|nr:cytochrome P450 3A8-like [Oppia nitens]